VFIPHGVGLLLFHKIRRYMFASHLLRSLKLRKLQLFFCSSACRQLHIIFMCMPSSAFRPLPQPSSIFSRLGSRSSSTYLLILLSRTKWGTTSLALRGLASGLHRDGRWAACWSEMAELLTWWLPSIGNQKPGVARGSMAEYAREL
jgi:hypothetical protein